MNASQWKIPYRRPELPQALLEAGCEPLLAAALALRGVKDVAAARALLAEDAAVLCEPALMSGMAEAVARIRMALRHRECVAVYGDYDVDGITATCLVTDYLRFKGLRCLPYIPDRSEEGYGLNCSALDALKAQGVSLVITVDCGITALDEAAYARSIGLDMIVTDHHECKAEGLPDAVAVIDCKQPGDAYPHEYLAGVGVALKLVCACEGDAEAMLRRYCDLVAVGTVADVMPLVGENRYLVRRGLRMLAKRPRPGLEAILKEAAIEPRSLNAAAIGFGLAPRLNAAGRLGQAETALRLLMCDNREEAAALAGELCAMNRQRQSIELEIWQDAQALLEDREPDAPIVLASDRWNQGVVGIAASRLSEQYAVPAVMICLNGEQGKGSCRSFGGFNLFEALSACSEHLLGFGGHALAAGLTIRADKLEDFRAALTAYYRAHRPESAPELCCDMLIRSGQMLGIQNVRSLDRMEPFGNQNPRPLLCLSGVPLLHVENVGKDKQHLRLRVDLGGESFDGIFFSHTAQELGLKEGDLADLAFNPRINEFRGNLSVQLQIVAARPHDGRALCRLILAEDREALWAAADYYPCRTDFARVWRESAPGLCRTSDLESILALCPAGMAEERYCLCLMALRETGLLRGPGGGITGAEMQEMDGKADLEGTALLQSLRAMSSI